MTWKWVFTGLVCASIGVAVVLMFLTARNKSYVAQKRRREKRFKPDWDRGKPEDRSAGAKRRGIRIRR